MNTPRKTFHLGPDLENELGAILLIQQALRGRYVLLITPVRVDAWRLENAPRVWVEPQLFDSAGPAIPR